MTNDKRTQQRVSVLVQYAKHRGDRVFQNDLIEFLSSDRERYFFLSEDYYENWLTKTPDGSLTLATVSEKDEIIERTAGANRLL